MKSRSVHGSFFIGKIYDKCVFIIEIKATVNTLPETLPELCNEFYTDFMENNHFFGVDSDDEKNEIIEVIQHFCIWLFKNEYTKSKLSLAQ